MRGTNPGHTFANGELTDVQIARELGRLEEGQARVLSELDQQRREYTAQVESVRRELREAITAQGAMLSAQIAGAQRLRPLDRAVYLLCALSAAGALLWMALRTQGAG